MAAPPARRRWWVDDGDGPALARLRHAALTGDVESIIQALSPRPPMRQGRHDVDDDTSLLASARVAAAACAAAARLAASSSSPWEPSTRRALAKNVCAALTLHWSYEETTKRAVSAIHRMRHWRGGVDLLAEAGAIFPLVRLTASGYCAGDLSLALQATATLRALIDTSGPPAVLAKRVEPLASSMERLMDVLTMLSDHREQWVPVICNVATILAVVASRSMATVRALIDLGAIELAGGAHTAHRERGDVAAACLRLLSTLVYEGSEATIASVLDAGGVALAAAAVRLNGVSNTAVCQDAAYLLRFAARLGVPVVDSLMDQGAAPLLASIVQAHGLAPAGRGAVIHACIAIGTALPDTTHSASMLVCTAFLVAGAHRAIRDMVLSSPDIVTDEELAFNASRALAGLAEVILGFRDEFFSGASGGSTLALLLEADLPGVVARIETAHADSPRVGEKLASLRAAGELCESMLRAGVVATPRTTARGGEGAGVPE